MEYGSIVCNGGQQLIKEFDQLQSRLQEAEGLLNQITFDYGVGHGVINYGLYKEIEAYKATNFRKGL